MLINATDNEVARLAGCLRERRLPACIDIRQRVEQSIKPTEGEPRATRQAKINLVCSNVETALKGLPLMDPEQPVRLLVDRYARPPYKRYQDSNTPLNRILIRVGAGAPRDMAELSGVIAGAETFSVSRAYVFRDDTAALTMVENAIRTEIEREGN